MSSHVSGERSNKGENIIVSPASEYLITQGTSLNIIIQDFVLDQSVPRP